MTIDSFLEEVGPFTFVFQYDNTTVRKHFSLSDLQRYFDGAKKRNSEASPAQAPQVQQAPISDQQWAPISAPQAATLTARLKLLPLGRVVVACASVYCRDLADGLVASIHDAGWNVRPRHGGGLGVDGVTGIDIDQDTPTAVELRDAIENTTGLKVALHPLPAGYAPPPEIWLVIGTKPF